MRPMGVCFFAAGGPVNCNAMNELHFFHFDEAFLTVAFPGLIFKFSFRLVLYDQSMNRTAAGKQQTKKGA